MVATVREPLTYHEHSQFSFFRDLIRAQTMHDEEAQARLDQHGREMRVEEQSRAARPMTTLADGSDIEYRQTRVDSNLGTGGEFTIPLWLIDKFATAGRAGRPFGDLLQPMVLPAGVSSIHVPRITIGSTVGNQQFDGAATPGGDPVTADTNSNVVTIAGEVLVSQQLMDLSPIGLDAAWFLDLQRAYNRQLEFQLLYGSAGNSGAQSPGQLLGVGNISGINSVNGSTGTTIATLWPLMGQIAAAIGNNRFLPPEVYLFAPRRWFWIASSVDNSSRPIASPGAGPRMSDLAAAGGTLPFGPVHGVPVYLDGAIPAGTSADDIFCLRPSDMFLWESTPRTIAAPNPLSGTLQYRLSYHRYVAFIGNRYPTGIGRLTGLTQPANF